MTFCRQCGTRLEAGASTPSPGAGPATASGTDVPCPRCKGMNPVGFNFCQHCGHRMKGNTSPPESPPTPPSGMPVSTATPAVGAVVSTSQPPARIPTPVSVPVMSGPGPVSGAPELAVAPLTTAAGYRGGRGAETPAGLPETAAGTIGQPGAAAGHFPSPQPAGHSPVRLVSVNRDGSDGVVFPITADRFDIGRKTGTLLFEDDGYLSERHVRLERRQGRTYLEDLDSLNGVYIRIRQREELLPGLKFLIGMQLMVFDVIPERERDPAPAMEHGVLVFGTPPKLPWARARQLTTAGITRDVYHLYRAEVVIGRESGDIVFSDDDFMSRMHAAIRNEGGKAWLVDLNSSNGTYIQVRGSRALVNGDFLRLGDQLLRFEES